MYGTVKGGQAVDSRADKQEGKMQYSLLSTFKLRLGSQESSLPPPLIKQQIEGIRVHGEGDNAKILMGRKRRIFTGSEIPS
ncbi:uncharacterized protein LOC128352409 isoform X4 [Hemicordylus capensis]|uniref:uncharacterized protein LOC128352409 isoform X4 n=1 Tax=Hemicordylus capensis TaxID=884348 RepID=UPI0023027648|nr:uncharacterized protein LOC128352409 isoform X4 [Hemicordylus capensis]XP_053168953.1 uncharacterized protein LOC128352409 isoform X4 [Hemicordylus capensis]